MSRKILSIVVLLMAVVLGGCVTSQIRHPDGRVENRYEVLGPSMNYSYGVNRGYAPIGYVGGNSYRQMNINAPAGVMPNGTIVNQIGRPIGHDVRSNSVPIGVMPNGDAINIHGYRYKP